MQPHRVRTFKTSNDPAFAAKVEDDAAISSDCHRLEHLRDQIAAYHDRNPEAEPGQDPGLAQLMAQQTEAWERVIYAIPETWSAKLAKARAALVMAERDRDDMITTNGASEDLAW